MRKKIIEFGYNIEHLISITEEVKKALTYSCSKQQFEQLNEILINKLMINLSIHQKMSIPEISQALINDFSSGLNIIGTLYRIFSIKELLPRTFVDELSLIFVKVKKCTTESFDFKVLYNYMDNLQYDLKCLCSKLYFAWEDNKTI